MEAKVKAAHIAISTILTSLDPTKAKVATFAIYVGSHNYEFYEYKRLNGEVKWPIGAHFGDFDSDLISAQISDSLEQMSLAPIPQEELLGQIAKLLNQYAGSTFLLGDTAKHFDILKCMLLLHKYTLPVSAHEALHLGSLEWFLPRAFIEEREYEFEPFIDYHYRNMAMEAEYIYRMFMHLMPYRKKQPTRYLLADETISQTPSDDPPLEVAAVDEPPSK